MRGKAFPCWRTYWIRSLTLLVRPPFSCSNTIFHPCYADKENQFVVNYDARIFKCTARNFSTSPHEGTLLKNGTIKWLNKITDKENKYISQSTKCLSCPILPKCNKGCFQKRKEVNADYCFHDTTSKKLEYAKKSFWRNFIGVINN